MLVVEGFLKVKQSSDLVEKTGTTMTFWFMPVMRPKVLPQPLEMLCCHVESDIFTEQEALHYIRNYLKWPK